MQVTPATKCMRSSVPLCASRCLSPGAYSHSPYTKCLPVCFVIAHVRILRMHTTLRLLGLTYTYIHTYLLVFVYVCATARTS